MGAVAMEFRFRKRDPAYFTLSYIFGLIFFRAKSITDAVLYIKRILPKF
jgi:hypothetical protein